MGSEQRTAGSSRPDASPSHRHKRTSREVLTAALVGAMLSANAAPLLAQLVRRVLVGRAPTEVLVAGHTAFASVFGDGEVVAVDLASASVVSRTFVGALPEGLSLTPDGATLLIAALQRPSGTPFPGNDCFSIVFAPQNGRLAALDAGTGALRGSVPLLGGPPFATLPLSDGRTALVATTQGSVNVVDLAGMVLGRTVPLGISQAVDAVASRDGRTLFVSASPAGPDLVVFDIVSGTVRSVPFGPSGCVVGSGGHMKVDPLDEHLLVNATCGGAAATAVVGVRSERIDAVVPGGFGAIAFSPDGTLAYLLGSDYPWDSGQVLNLATLEVVDSVPVGGAGAEVSPDGARLYATSFGGLYRRRVEMGPAYAQPYDLTIVDLVDGSVRTTLISDPETCSFSRGIALSSEGRYAVTNESAIGAVTVFDLGVPRPLRPRLRSGPPREPR